MVDLGSAYFQLTPSLSGFSGSITRQLGGVGSSAGKTAGAGFTGAFRGALAPLAGIAAASIGIGAVTGFISDSVNAASELEQSLGGVDAVFGESADSIHKWAKEGAKSVGLSENAYNGLASVIGSQLKNAGESMDKVAGKTKGLIKTGADLSATFGGTAAEAVEAISSALRGERDPIEKYGVSLNQAAVDAEAARLGFTKVGGALSTQANQAATLSLIYKQTSAATGQFAKQSDTLAEKQQIFAATFENVKAKIGNAFLPAITDVVGAFSNLLEPALEAIQPKLDGLSGKLAGVGGAISGFFSGFTGPADTGPITQPLDKFVAAGQAVKQFIDDTSPVIQTYLGILRGLAPVIGGAFATIGPALGAALAQIGPALATAIPPLATAVVTLLPSLVDLILALLPIIPPLAGIIVSLAPVISDLAGVLVFLINNAVKPLVESVGGFIRFFVEIAKGGLTLELAMRGLNGEFGTTIQVIGTFATALGVGVGNALRFVRELPGKAAAALGNVGTLLVSSGKALIDGFINGIKGAAGAVGDAVGGVLSFARGFFPESPAKRGPFSGSGWTGLKKSGGAIAAQFGSGFDQGMIDFGSKMSSMVPDTISSSVAGTITNTSKAPSTSVLIANKTNVRLEDLVDVRIARSDEESSRAQRLGYQPLVFG